MGHSAGGYLALMAGVRFRPRPRAIVSFDGYGDIAGSWHSRPDPGRRVESLALPEPVLRKLFRENALRSVAGLAAANPSKP